MGVNYPKLKAIWKRMMDDVGNETLRRARPDMFTHTIDPDWETFDGFVEWARTQPHETGRFDRSAAHTVNHYGPGTCTFKPKAAPKPVKRAAVRIYNPITRSYETVTTLQELRQRKRDIAIELAGGPDIPLPEILYPPIHRQPYECAFHDFTQHAWPLTFHRQEFADADGQRHLYKMLRTKVMDRKRDRELCREATLLMNFARQSDDIEHITMLTNGYTTITRTNGMVLTGKAVEEALQELDDARWEDWQDARRHNAMV